MPDDGPVIIGVSRSTEKIREIIRKVADVDLNVLISGESGVGKELVARSLHYYSSRKKRPFIKVNCAALPGELIETELFGYEKGAFTGADKQRMGKFEAAADGSIFLDEIGEIPQSLQAKLLQVLQDQKFPRIGGHREIEARARVIAATNRNLEAEILSGNFREDLYFRINTISIVVPPLRERPEDVEPLVHYFLEHLSKKHRLPKPDLSPRLMKLLQTYHWPGNVRELENYLKRLLVMGESKEIEAELESGGLNRNPAPEDDPSPSPEAVIEEAAQEALADNHNPREEKQFPSLKEVRDRAVQRVERALIKQVLEETNWNRREAAKILKISYRALLYKLKDMDLSPR
ncbi:two-component system, NtrC family, response regulator AtoC [Desulfacinum hydrothermale DSM 13146]|uniref:Two-component system, NtrC family, response regulator AtoC n=1 Tax=Desulfacinum hydrothermale DSM 13146 TaxID=1121390 RepID=A0A1W1XRT7_9BACT|nr:sigma-54 dependent transcriptional regulator [Desulfacinum hydrothermale]SMC26251.1 two-component system, NtrC family, response regulator AtoC [Desulfacinum hydrothermale DSM 13146]